MKLPTMVGSLLFTAIVQAVEPDVASQPPAGVPLRPVTRAQGAQPEPAAQTVTVRWNEKKKDQVSVVLKNTEDAAWAVLGVQTTGGLFVTGFPKEVKAGGEENLTLIYDAAENAEGDTELVRVKTDRGIKTLAIRVAREEAVRFDTREVVWTVGEKNSTKSVTLTVAQGTVTPKKLRVSGGEHKAELETVNNTTYRVKITPASTAKSGRFSVMVEFSQALPGVAPVIVGTIEPKE